MTQIDVMEKTLQAQRPRLNFSTAVTLVSVRELISWDILPTQRTAASKNLFIIHCNVTGYQTNFNPLVLCKPQPLQRF